MSTFSYELMRKIHESLFHVLTDNTEKRFGNIGVSEAQKLLDENALHGVVTKDYLENLQHRLDEYFRDKISYFDHVYSLLEDEESRATMVNVMAYRFMGYRRVRVADMGKWSQRKLDRLSRCMVNTDSVVTGSSAKTREVFRYDLERFDIPVSVYSHEFAVNMIFFVEQYSYYGSRTVTPELGDYVIDAGGAWGDTALYFANKVGKDGKVFSFEFIEENLNVFKKTLSINPELSRRIMIEPAPLWNKSHEMLDFSSSTTTSTVSAADSSLNSEDLIESVCIDEFVVQKGIDKIDFIKMDIEGAEMDALQGGINTIKTHRPKLAISIYHHHYLDLLNVTLWVKQLDLGYKFYLKHANMYQDETVLFAIVD